MSRQRPVAVAAVVTPGAFSGERHYSLVMASGEVFKGVAPAGSCHEGLPGASLVNATELMRLPDGGGVVVSIVVAQGTFEVVAVPAASVVDRPAPAEAKGSADAAELARLRAENERLRDLLDRAGETLSLARGACQDASLQPGDRYGTAAARIDRLFDEFSASPDKRRGPLRAGGGGRW